MGFPQPLMSSVSFCSSMQEGEKRLLAFTKRGTATHSVSSLFFNFCLLFNIYSWFAVVSINIAKEMTIWTAVWLPKGKLDFNSEIFSIDLVVVRWQTQMVIFIIDNENSTMFYFCRSCSFVTLQLHDYKRLDTCPRYAIQFIYLKDIDGITEDVNTCWWLVWFKCFLCKNPIHLQGGALPIHKVNCEYDCFVLFV